MKKPVLMEIFYKYILTDQYLIHVPYINILFIFGLNLDPRQLSFLTMDYFNRLAVLRHPVLAARWSVTKTD